MPPSALELLNAPAPVQQNWLAQEDAIQEVVAFARQFGLKHLRLACHIALPMLVTPELVNLIRLNFLGEEQIPWYAEADFLLSHLCKAVDPGIYAVEPRVRQVLLVQLEKEYGWRRLQALADFLLAYLSKNPDLPTRRTLRRTHQWVARAYLDPDGLVSEMNSLLARNLTTGSGAADELTDRIQLSAMVETLADPLRRTGKPEEQRLLKNSARALSYIVSGREQEIAEAIFQAEASGEELAGAQVLPAVAHWLEANTAVVTAEQEKRHPIHQRVYQDFIVILTNYTPDFAKFEIQIQSRWGEQTAISRLNDKMKHHLDRLEMSGRLSSDALVDLGVMLADSLLPEGAVREIFIQAVESLGVEEGIRLRLVMSDPELMRLPWEVVSLQLGLGDRVGGLNFLALHPKISLVRDISSPNARFLAPITNPLQMAVVMSSPESLQPLDLQAERNAIQEAVHRSDSVGADLMCNFIEAVTVEGIHDLLRKNLQIFHFAGHGSYDRISGTGAILVGDNQGGIEYVFGEELAQLLSAADVRLAFFNSEYSSAISTDPALNCVAIAAVRAGIPVVIGLQIGIEDALAIVFSKAFYNALFVGLNIDEAMSHARLALAAQQEISNSGWGIPTLYLSGQAEAVLFPFGDQPVSEAPPLSINIKQERDVRGEAGERPEQEEDDVLPEPGELPAGSCRLLRRNPAFVGHAEKLKLLWSALRPREKPDARYNALITGMGGSGKTQLALEFCYRYGRRFQGVHWISADRDIPAGIAACGGEMGLSPWPEGQAEQVQLTLQAWQDGGRLVVLDNILEKTVLEAWLPRLGNASVLATSRMADWMIGKSLTIPLNGLERSDSLALLRTLAPELSGEEDALLEQLAERLGDLPLALDLAGRYLHSRTRQNLSDYLQELEKGGSLLENDSMRGASSFSPTEHNTSLLDTFSAQWQMLTGQGEVETQARQLFITCSYLAPDTNIPMALMAASLMPDLEFFTADYGIGPALNLLTGLSLMDEWQETEEVAAGQSIHPLLADFGRGLDDDRDGLRRLVRGLVTMANAAGESGRPDHYELLLPHLQVVAMHADQVAGLEEETGMLWNALGTHSEMTGVYEQAVNYYQRGLAVYERRDRQGHPYIAVLAEKIGNVQRRMGDLKQAQATLERALDFCRRAYGEGHPLAATITIDLGQIAFDRGDLGAARNAFETALAIDEKANGPRHPDVARDLNNLGTVLRYERSGSGPGSLRAGVVNR